MMVAQEAFEVADSEKVIDVVKVVGACQSGMWSVRGFSLEQSSDAGKLFLPMVAAAAAGFRVVVGLRVEWQPVVRSAFLEVYPQEPSSDLESLCFLLQSILSQSSDWLWYALE